MRSTTLLLAPLPLFLLGFGSCEPATTSTPDDAGAAGTELNDPAAPDTGAACFPLRSLSCGEAFAGDTGDWNDGATDAVDFYAGVVGNFAGPELTWRLDAVTSGTVDVRFVDPAPSVLNHDLHVLDAGLGCHGEAAFARGFNSVSIDVVAGRSYFLVVDAPEGVDGPWRRHLGCRCRPGPRRRPAPRPACQGRRRQLPTGPLPAACRVARPPGAVRGPGRDVLRTPT